MYHTLGHRCLLPSRRYFFETAVLTESSPSHARSDPASSLERVARRTRARGHTHILGLPLILYIVRAVAQCGERFSFSSLLYPLLLRFQYYTFCTSKLTLNKSSKSHVSPEATGSPSIAPHWRSTSKTTTGAAAATLSEFLRPKVGISTQPCDACITRVSTPVSSLPGQGSR